MNDQVIKSKLRVSGFLLAIALILFNHFSHDFSGKLIIIMAGLTILFGLYFISNFLVAGSKNDVKLSFWDAIGFSKKQAMFSSIVLFLIFIWLFFFFVPDCLQSLRQ